MTSYANRGKFLERVINQCNAVYRHKGIALINQIPTPINMNKKNKNAFYSGKSTVDYTGVAQGTFIAFDAKETKASSFQFSRLQQHQKDYLIDAHKHQGQAFILILFTQANELYRIDIDDFIKLEENIGRKSIPLSWFRDNKRPITSRNGLYYDYLNIT